MPTRWFLPIHGLDPRRVPLDFAHAAFTGWFDLTHAEHTANDKPYAVSPITSDGHGGVGVEIATLTEVAEQRFVARAEPKAVVRLGNQTRPVGRPRVMLRESWSELARHHDDSRWELNFLTPATFRSGDRSSPLPQPRTIVQRLARSWRAWSDSAIPPIDEVLASLWVCDLDLHSTTIPLRISRRDGARQDVTLSGALGTLVLRCDEPATAAAVGPLVRLAAFTGVGSMTAKGLGVTRVRAHRRSALAATPEPIMKPHPVSAHASFR